MMRLSLYVGSLTSHFLTPLRVAARGAGQDEPDEASVREQIDAWRTWISAGLEANGLLPRPLAWDETAATDDTHDLAAHALQALKLFLAHGGSPSCPPELPAQPAADPAWVAMAEADFQDSPYDQILVPELWLPAAFDFTFACPLPDGHELQTGSLDALLVQCTNLRERSFAGTPVDAVVWAENEVEGRGTRALARHALGRLERAASSASRRDVPMLLHPA